MKLVAGLGNIGREYQNTRHNIGFMCLDRIADAFHVQFDRKKLNGSYAEITYQNEKVILLKPEKYMNLSGEVISAFVRFYKISPLDLLVISDDLDMPTGKVKLKHKGSSGGHNGLKDIEKNLGTQEYKRLKIGIANNKKMDTKDYVLGKFSKDEEKILEETLTLIPKIFMDYLDLDFDNVMNKYNKK